MALTSTPTGLAPVTLGTVASTNISDAVPSSTKYIYDSVILCNRHSAAVVVTMERLTGSSTTFGIVSSLSIAANDQYTLRLGLILEEDERLKGWASVDAVVDVHMSVASVAESA